MQTNERVEPVPVLVDHLFRRQAGQVVATLTRIFGPQHLDLVEDVVQDTLLKALRHWPYRGVPDNPGGWIMQVARNQALDHLRRETRLRERRAAIAAQLAELSPEGVEETDGGPRDDLLRMMFMCCHPALSHEARVTLTLKTLCGFGVTEIARAFLTSETAIAQRLVRAKRTLRERPISFELPGGEELAARLDAVLDVLYLLFTEGYSAHAGANLVRHELCAEAIRLTTLLAAHPLGDAPRVHALLALMLLQASRLPARTDAEGALVLLEEQDRSRWEHDLIGRGLAELARSAAGDALTAFHVQAGIAACHAVAPSHAATDWRRVLEQFNALMELAPSPVVALNRAVALAEVHGPSAGLVEVEALASQPGMACYHLLPATQGELWRRLGERRRATMHYRRALELAPTGPERRFLLRRLAECEA